MESENGTVNKDRSGYIKTYTPSQNPAMTWNEGSGRVKQHIGHEGEGGERDQYTTEDKRRPEDSRRGDQGRYWWGRSEQRPRSVGDKGEGGGATKMIVGIV